MRPWPCHGLTTPVAEIRRHDAPKMSAAPGWVRGMALVQGWLVAVISGDPGAGGDVSMVAFACGQVNASGGHVVAVCGTSGARRVRMGTGDEGRGCG